MKQNLYADDTFKSECQISEGILYLPGGMSGVPTGDEMLAAKIYMSL